MDLDSYMSSLVLSGSGFPRILDDLFCVFLYLKSCSVSSWHYSTTVTSYGSPVIRSEPSNPSGDPPLQIRLYSDFFPIIPSSCRLLCYIFSNLLSLPVTKVPWSPLISCHRPRKLSHPSRLSYPDLSLSESGLLPGTYGTIPERWSKTPTLLGNFRS